MSSVNSFPNFLQRLSRLEQVVKTLPKSIPLAKKSDAVFTVFQNIPIPEDVTGHFEAFNRRMDALFGNDVRDPVTGRLVNIRRGPFGIDLVVKYLREATDAGYLLWNIAILKVDRLIEEIEIIRYVYAEIFCIYLTLTFRNQTVAHLPQVLPPQHP
jgi:hypothetical protein